MSTLNPFSKSSLKFTRSKMFQSRCPAAFLGDTTLFGILGLEINMGSRDGSTRRWSCSTLADGVDALLEQSRVAEQQEEDIKKLVEDPVPNNSNFYIYLHFPFVIL